MSTIWTTNSRTSRKSYDDWRTLARSDVAVTASDAATEIQRATGQAVAGRRAGLLGAQKPLWDVWSDHCFRVEVEGWQRLPGGPSLLVEGALTMDAWTFVGAWYGGRSG
jgi:hypothetical protein